MSTRCAATAKSSRICSEGGRHTRASGIGERGQHAVAGGEIAIRVDGPLDCRRSQAHQVNQAIVLPPLLALTGDNTVPCQHGTLHFYVWLGLIALKTHLKGSQAPGTLGCT